MRAFLDEHKVMQVATIGPRGRPHLVPLWYVPDGLELRGWTYAKSQKARNLERDPRATIAIEDGIEYHELRGVTGYGEALVERYHRGSQEMREGFRAQARKRVGLRFVPTRLVSWDHRKLDGY